MHFAAEQSNAAGCAGHPRKQNGPGLVDLAGGVSYFLRD